MQFVMRGVLQTGVATLDTGLKDIDVAVVNGVVHVYATSGRNGGLSGFTIGPTGEVSVTVQHLFAPSVTAAVSDTVTLEQVNGVARLFYASNDQGLSGFSVNANGSLGAATSLSWTQGASSMGSGDWMQASADLSDRQIAGFPGAYDCAQIISLDSVTMGTTQFVVTTCVAKNGVTVFGTNPTTGALSPVSGMGADEGLGIQAPTAMQVVELGGQSFVVLAAAGTDSLSVMRLTPTGGLEPTEHLLDNASTLFRDVQALGSVTIGEHAFVVAGGSDNGLTLFRLTPEGRLVFIDTLADTGQTSLHSVSTIRLVAEGGILHVFAGSQNDAGMTHLTVDVSALGQNLRGTTGADRLTGGAGHDLLLGVGADDTLDGGGGDDVLISTGGGSVLTGGNGADIFVIRDGGGQVRITDFRPGVDRLDLTDLPMLRDVAQLRVSATGNGATIEYRANVIQIVSDTAQPLTLTDLFPNGLQGGDHIPFVPLADDPGPGVVLTGTEGRDLIEGTALSDTLSGGIGRDTILGGDGNDLIDGGAQHDEIRVTGGNNQIFGGAGRDIIWGADDGDYIDGGTGVDWIYAGEGNDTIIGGGGRDVIYARGGDDHITMSDTNSFVHGQRGRDTIIGGAGDDQLYGGADDDSLSGGGGVDILSGWTGNDIMDGGAGNDWLWGEWGDDFMRGGDDNDLMWGGDGNDTVRGDWGDDLLDGGNGNDAINGGPGADTIRGSAGTDYIWGGSEADLFIFRPGTGDMRLMDVSASDGDIVRLSQALWTSAGTLTVEDVIATYGRVDGNGHVVLDFTAHGDAVITFSGHGSFATLQDVLQVT